MSDTTTVEEPKAEETAGSAAPTSASKFADEAEGLSAEIERLFRRAFGEIPRASDLGELRSIQAMLKGLVHRAASESEGEGGGAGIAELTAERDKLKDALQREKAGVLNYQSRSMKDFERAEDQ